MATSFVELPDFDPKGLMPLVKAMAG